MQANSSLSSLNIILCYGQIHNLCFYTWMSFCVKSFTCVQFAYFLLSSTVSSIFLATRTMSMSLLEKMVKFSEYYLQFYFLNWIEKKTAKCDTFCHNIFEFYLLFFTPYRQRHKSYGRNMSFVKTSEGGMEMQTIFFRSQISVDLWSSDYSK